MRNDIDNPAGVPGDDAFNADEEALFESLIAESNTWVLTNDWSRQLLAQITAVDKDARSIRDLGGHRGEAEVVDLSVERQARSRPPLALVATIILFIIGLGGVVLFGAPTVGVTNVAVIPASQSVDAPVVSPVDVPEGTHEIVTAADGTIVAVIEGADTNEVVLATSADLVTWELGDALPLSFAVVDASTDVWYAVGGDPASLVQFGRTEATRLPTALRGFSSTDRGQTWSEIGAIPLTDLVHVDEVGVETRIPFTETVPAAVWIGAVDDQLLVSVNEVAVTNWTALARQAGLVDDQTFVVWDGVDDYFAYGPGTADEIEITATDLNLDREAFDELRFGTSSMGTSLHSSVGTAPFESQELPDGRLVLGSLEARNDEFIFSGVRAFARNETLVFSSTDGRSWVESDKPPVTEVSPQIFAADSPLSVGDTLRLSGQLGARSSNDGTDVLTNGVDWQVRITQESGQFAADEASVGSSDFDPVPRPEVDAQLVGGFGTDFGAALVWQDQNTDDFVEAATVIEDDGYVFEFVANFVKVTNPEGAVVVERQALSGQPVAPVIVDNSAEVLVVNEQADIVASVSFADFQREVLRTGVQGQASPARFISWASGPDTWTFAPLEGLDSAFWDFIILENGILATALGDPTEALFIEWPAEFSE